MKKCWFCGEEIPDATVVCPWCGRRQKDPDAASEPPQSKTSRIANVRLFAERPSSWETGSNLTIWGPDTLIESADRELELDGDLVSYVEAHGGFLRGEVIERLEDPERESFFTSQAKSPLWTVYCVSGGVGIRYYVLVEFNREDEGTLLPDYGLHLMSSGWSKSAPIYLLNCRISHIDILDNNRYRATMSKTTGGKQFAITYDFGEAILQSIIQMAPDRIRRLIERGVETKESKSSAIIMVEFNEMLPVGGFVAHLGDVERTDLEEFVPLIVDHLITG